MSSEVVSVSESGAPSVSHHSGYSDVFLSMQYNILAFIVAAIALWPVRRPVLFVDWSVTGLSNFVIVMGSCLRLYKIWPGQVNSARESFFIYTLPVWIAWVVLDGRHSFGMLKWYGRERVYHMLHKTPRPKQLFQLFFTAVSCLSLLIYGTLVYRSFARNTTNVWIYIWYYVTTFFKVYRIFLQGLLLAADSDHVLIRQNRSFALQLILTNLMSLWNISCLPQLLGSNLHFTLSAVIYLDLAYRIIWTASQGWVYFFEKDPPQQQSDVSSQANSLSNEPVQESEAMDTSHANKIDLRPNKLGSPRETALEKPQQPEDLSYLHPYPFHKYEEVDPLDEVLEFVPFDEVLEFVYTDKILFCCDQLHWRKCGELFPELQYYLVTVGPPPKRIYYISEKCRSLLELYMEERSHRMHKPGD